jgi:hypothetical protein
MLDWLYTSIGRIRPPPPIRPPSPARLPDRYRGSPSPSPCPPMRSLSHVDPQGDVQSQLDPALAKYRPPAEGSALAQGGGAGSVVPPRPAGGAHVETIDRDASCQDPKCCIKRNCGLKHAHDRGFFPQLCRNGYRCKRHAYNGCPWYHSEEIGALNLEAHVLEVVKLELTRIYGSGVKIS